MRYPGMRRLPAAGWALMVGLALTAAGCGGSDSHGSSATGLEKSTITVGYLPVADGAQLKLAIDRGFFKAEGLTVKIRMMQGGADAPPLMQSGAIDLALGAYVAFFQAKANGFPLHIVADVFEIAPGTHTIMVNRDSPIHTVRDLQGKRIAVNVKHNLATLLIQATVKPQGVKLDENKSFVPVQFPNMLAALKTHQVDAVQAVEPFGTQMEKEIGARMLTDLSQGPTANFPVGGYASTEQWAKKNPKTLAAFQRAIYKAQLLLADRQVLAHTLTTYTQIDAATAATLHVGVYPTSINITRLQRVVDTMRQYGYLKQPIDVKALVSN